MGRRDRAASPEIRLRRLRRRAAWGIWTAGFARAVAPCCGILLAYCVAALFGFGSALTFPFVALLAAMALGHGLKRLRWAGREAVDRRIERVSGLRHRPLAVLEDAPEDNSEISAALWRLHRRQAAAALRWARGGWPVTDAALHDPYALRGLLLLLLVTGAIIAGPAGMPRLAAAFKLPAWPFTGPQVNAWITAPGYAGTPPLLLLPGHDPTVLAGSRLSVVVDGAGRRPAAFLDGGPLRLDGSAAQGFRAEAVLRVSGRFTLGTWWRRLAAWKITVLPPAAPGLWMRQPQAINHLLLIGWRARDRYGLVSLKATLAPAGRQGALAQSLPLPLDGPAPLDADGLARLDIANSPYAGLPVNVTLTARNLAGVEGSAGPMRVLLPPVDWRDKTAALLAALRQRLTLAPVDAAAPGQALQKLATAPASRISASADVQMAYLARRMQAGKISADAAQARLGRLAAEVEEGPDYAPARALMAADQALEQALRQGLEGRPPDDSRLQALLTAMQEALARHLQALQGMRQGQGAPDVPPLGGTIGLGMLEQMARQIARDEAGGRAARAQAELNRLEQLLNALQSATPMTAEQAKNAAASAEAARVLSGITRDESALLDQTNQGDGSPQAQAVLRERLAGVSGKLAQAGVSLPGLDQAAGAMRAAQAALARQSTGAAMTAEGTAIAALQNAQATLAKSRQGMFLQEETAPGAAGAPGGLGGAPDEESIPGLLPSGNSAAEAIQRQIIHNDGNPALPAGAHRYYHRLLDGYGP